MFWIIEEEIFKFLRNSFYGNKNELKKQFVVLHQKLKQYEKMRFESRTFAYLDIISWLESKILNKPMAFILKEKFEASKR